MLVDSPTYGAELGGAYATQMDAHPPFQIEGNLGGKARITETLLQSNNGDIVFLPALPNAWPEGTGRGLYARGAFEVDIMWDKGTWAAVSVLLKKGNECTIGEQDKVSVFCDGRPENYVSSSILKLRVYAPPASVSNSVRRVGLTVPFFIP